MFVTVKRPALSARYPIIGMRFQFHHRREVLGSSHDGSVFPGTCALNCTNGTSEAFAFHPGGANMVFGDGSVHFLQEGLDIRVFARMVTRKGAEVISGTDKGE